LRLSRRSGLRLLAGAACTALLAPVAACRQPKGRRSDEGPRRVGLLLYQPSAPVLATRGALLASLAAQGYAQGRELQLLQRDAAGSQARCRQGAAELVAAQPDLLLAIGTPSLLAAMAAAPPQLPIVFCYCSNPWGAGAGRSARQHRANVTGTVTTNPVARQLELARSLVGRLRRVGLLYNPAEPNASFEAELLAQAAAEQRLQLLREPLAHVSELPEAFVRLRRGAPQALLQVGDYVSQEGFARLAALALAARIPLFGVDPAFAGVPGCLAVVGWDPCQDGRQAGLLAARVLAGTSPAQLPFELPGKPGIWLNPLTAQRLGLALPPALRAQALLVHGPAAAATSCD
jgi:putative tryptophan/tyrosine transport system substrate-binding protein